MSSPSAHMHRSNPERLTLPCSGSLPGVPGEFANLRILNISGNSINGTVPAALGGAAMFKQVSCAEPGILPCSFSGAWLVVEAVAHVGPGPPHDGPLIRAWYTPPHIPNVTTCQAPK